MQTRVRWPNGKSFAFTIFDDTDRSGLDNAPFVYDFLYDLGFRTTKSVWPLRGSGPSLIPGATCEEPDYLDWVIKLQGRGFEIGLHNVTYHTSSREETRRGIERFRELFGHYPYSMTNHAENREGIYWGSSRLSGILSLGSDVVSYCKGRPPYQGHVVDSPLFWGDICQQKIKYVRNFICADVNTLLYCPYMPYHDPERPYVNYWFASSDGAVPSRYVRTLSERNQDRLEEQEGACILYTHFGKRFVQNVEIDPRFKTLMERISRKNGWFVPVSTLLNYLLQEKGHHIITPSQRSRLEWKWLRLKLQSLGRE